MDRLGALQVALGAANRVLAAPDQGIATLQLGPKFRDLKNGQHLALLDAVADLHANDANVARHLGVDVHLLKGAELPRQLDRVRQGLSEYQGHRRRAGF